MRGQAKVDRGDAHRAMRLVTVVGARPQFVKAATVSRAIQDHNHDRGTSGAPVHEVLVHTGQHYDANLSDVFFRELQIPAPQYHLEIGSGSHGEQTGEILKRLEKVLVREEPDCVLVYGDTNSTLGGALAAVKLHIPVAHVEAGLRSFNPRMPEETNRKVTDHISTFLFCPTQTAVRNLAQEGITKGVHLVGDVMYESLQAYLAIAERTSTVLQGLGLRSKHFVLATVHRAENTEHPARLRSILTALGRIAAELPVVLPLHPRTAKILRQAGDGLPSQADGLLVVEPVSYTDMLMLENHARVVLTDSGGVQKEAYWLGVPCVTLRDESEWVETVQSGWNRIAGADEERIAAACREFLNGPGLPGPRAIAVEASPSGRIVALLSSLDSSVG